MTITTTLVAIQRQCRHLTAWVMGLLMLPAAISQTIGTLYDPQPPADSAYVRVIVVTHDGSVEVLMDGKPRLQSVSNSEPSVYMVVKTGVHKLTVQSMGKQASVDVALNVAAGRSLTVVLPSLRTDSKPHIFEDKASANKLKAMLNFYHLAPKAGPLDVLTADGSTKVFSGVAPGNQASLSVNPIAVEVQAVRSGEKAGLAKASLNMAQGQTYSLLLLPGDGEKLYLKAAVNTLERYTSK